MPMRSKICLVLFFLLVSHCPIDTCGASTNHALTYSLVRTAVEDYFGNDTVSTLSRRELRTWGDKALPYLRKMAMDPEITKGRVWNLVCSINELATQKATDLLVDIIAGETRVAPKDAIGGFSIRVNNNRDYLRDNAKFKTAIFKLALPNKDWFVRMETAEIMAQMDWKDGLPLLRSMLKDSNLSLREAAAKAIGNLSGEKITIDYPKTVFPEVSMNADLVHLIGKLQKHGWMTSSVSFDQWFDKTHGLLWWSGTSVDLYDDSLKPITSIKTSKMSHDFLMLPYKRNTFQLISLVSDECKPKAEYAVSLDAEGRELWRYRPRRAGIDTMAPLYNKKGEVNGVIFGPGGEDGIVAVDLSGNFLWNIKRQYVLYEIKTNRSIPTRIVTCGGSINIYSETGKQIGATPPKGSHIYVTNVEMFSDERGRLAIVAAGTTDNETPLIIRYNDMLQPVWKATLSHSVSGMAMVTPPGKERYFIIVMSDGELLIFDQDGTLKYRDKLPESKGNDYPLYGIKAGLLGNSHYAFSIGTLSGILIYEFKL
jgi:HEAT repeat